MAMTCRNKYVKRSHLSEAKFRQVLKLFCMDVPAVSCADFCNINRNTADRHYRLFRLRIAEICERDSPFTGEVEMDESYFGARRVKGRRERGAKGKTIVFGLLKRNGKVYVQVVPDVSRNTLMQVIEENVDKDSVVYTGGFRSYDGLVDWGYKHHYRVNHGADEFVDRGNPTNHINGIESFWGYAKHRLVKFKGIMKDDFNLYLKECEFRFNMRGEDIYKTLLKEFRQRPLN